MIPSLQEEAARLRERAVEADAEAERLSCDVSQWREVAERLRQAASAMDEPYDGGTREVSPVNDFARQGGRFRFEDARPMFPDAHPASTAAPSSSAVPAVPPRSSAHGSPSSQPAPERSRAGRAHDSRVQNLENARVRVPCQHCGRPTARHALRRHETACARKPQVEVRPDVPEDDQPAPVRASPSSQDNAPELPLRGLALGRARAAEPTTCPDCGRTLARGQLAQHQGSAACLEVQRRARTAERDEVLAAPARTCAPGESGGVVSISRFVECDLCGRKLPAHALREHRNGRPCRERRAEQAADRGQDAPAAPVDLGAPVVQAPARPRRAEDIPSVIGGRPVARDELRGVAAGMTRSIAAAPERVAGGGAHIEAREIAG